MTKTKQFSGKSIRRLLLQAVRALRTNKFDNAETYLNEVLTREPENNRGLAILFTTFYKNKQFDKARLIGSKAAELNPASQYILNNQACLLIGNGEIAPAKTLLDSLIEQYGATAQWLYNLGLAHLHDKPLHCQMYVTHLSSHSHLAELILLVEEIYLFLPTACDSNVL